MHLQIVGKKECLGLLCVAFIVVFTGSVFSFSTAFGKDTVQDVEHTEADFVDVELSRIEQRQFELSDEEVSRSQRLRLMDKSYGVSNLSAVELLGKYATTDAERLKYARKHVMAMADNVGRSQAWSMAVYEASQETNLVQGILSENPIIEAGLGRMRMAVPDDDYSDFDYIPPVVTEPGRTIFMSLDCGDKCDELFAKQYSLVLQSKVENLDVVFVGSDNSDTEAIFQWAHSMAITKGALESGSVKLHIDDPEWVEVRNGIESVPRLVK